MRDLSCSNGSNTGFPGSSRKMMLARLVCAFVALPAADLFLIRMLQKGIHTASLLQPLARFTRLKSVTLALCVQKARIQIWLFQQKDMRIEGRIIVSGGSKNLLIEYDASHQPPSVAACAHAGKRSLCSLVWSGPHL